MKIYPGKHLLTAVNKVDLNEEIVLGYINSNYNKEEISLNIREDFNYYETREILPYEVFTSDDSLYPKITLYNKNGPIDKKTQNSLLTRVDEKYIYTPNASMTFQPITFGYNVLAKKNIRYTSSRKFNIKAVCNDVEIAKKLIQYFAHIEDYNMFPTNIKFNSGDVKIESLINASLKEVDFIFIESKDGKYYKNNKIIKVEEFLNYQTTPFIICDQMPDEDPIDAPTNIVFSLKDNIAMQSIDINTDKYFKIPTDKLYIKYTTPFKDNNKYSPIIIKEFENRGYAVYCNKFIIDNLNKYYSIFYETLLSLYFNNYIATQTIYEWIADVMPDYIVQSGRLTQKDKFTSHMELHKLLSLYEGDVTPINVNVLPQKENTSPIVYYTGMASNYLTFKKITTSEYGDPIKGTNQISIFTERKNIMYFDDFIYSIKEKISDKITYKLENGILFVTILPFKNTYLDTLNFKSTIVLKYTIKDLQKQTIFVCWNKSNQLIELLDKENPKYITLADINISREEKTNKVYDMRRRGGGLGEDDKDEDGCLDVTNVLGRSYRKSGTLICTINIPLKYKNTENEIYDIAYHALKKHMIAEDLLILNLNFI